MAIFKLFLERIKLAVQKRTQAKWHQQKSYETWAAKGYDNTPEVSVIIQSHNKSVQVEHIVNKLRKRQSLEIIVVDDGSDLTHTRSLAKLLTGANEFLLHSNDLYENIMYDRTLRMANGKYIALLQDDDDFDSLEWINEAVRLFRKYPLLAILGGKDGMQVTFEDGRVKNRPCAPSGEGGVTFVPVVNRAPMWIRKDLYEQKLHHVDFAFAPFQYDDYELCLRAWLNGLQVGWYQVGFKSLGAGGMRLWNGLFTRQQYEKNGKLLYNLYHAKAERIGQLVEEANSQKAFARSK